MVVFCWSYVAWFDVDDNKNTNVYVSGSYYKNTLLSSHHTQKDNSSSPLIKKTTAEGNDRLCGSPSPGLPLDISSEEFVELMSKCGIVLRDPVTEEYKVKLYKDGQGNLKGDGLCCYLKV